MYVCTHQIDIAIYSGVPPSRLRQMGCISPSLPVSLPASLTLNLSSFAFVFFPVSLPLISVMLKACQLDMMERGWDN